MTLYELGEQERQLEEALFETGGEITEEIAELMAANADNLAEKVEGYRKIMAEYDTLAAGCDDEIKRLTTKKKQANNAKDRLKAHILDLMVMFDWVKLTGANGSKVSRSSRKSVVVDEERVLAPYDLDAKIAALGLPDYITLVPKIDKTILKNAIEAGQVVPDGAEIAENEFITIR